MKIHHAHKARTEWLADIELPGETVGCAQHCGVPSKDDWYYSVTQFMKGLMDIGLKHEMLLSRF